MGNSSINHRRRHKNAAPIGGVFIILAIIGVISVGVFGYNSVKGLFDDTKKKQEFAEYLLPIVMFDPVPFDAPKDADQLALLQSALWSTLYSEKRESYTYSDMGLLMVPISDVDVESAKLFGSDIKLEHRSFGDMEINYILNEELAAYEIPMMVQVGYYTPRILDINKRADTYTLKVGYIPPGNAWTGDVGGKKYEPEPDKYMYYELKKHKSGYTIMSIKYPTVDELAADASSAPASQSSSQVNSNNSSK